MIYVTSDWHGYSLEKIKELFKLVNFTEDDYCFVLGDVIDRGDDGVKILKWLMEQPNIELILGNHEAMMLSSSFIFEEVTEESINNMTEDNIRIFLVWKNNGAEPTIDALHKNSKEDNEYLIEYLRDAPLYEQLTVNGKQFLLTHSGLGNFEINKDISEYDKSDYLWNRPKPDDRYYDDKITIFGHTPTLCFGDEYSGKAVVTDTWIDIDTGAAYGFAPMLLRLDDMKEFYIE